MNEGKLQSKDIGHVLKGWDYEPGTINVRKINGNDGQPKLQMRLDLGLLQMEMIGRPDGVRPHGCESLLEYYEELLKEHRQSHGSELGFHLTREQCQNLREEAVMYYHRYLSLFVLEEFPGVVRDTARNLRVLDLCGQYASDESDRIWLEQYRPYITMMNAKASASLLLRDNKAAEAHRIVQDALRSIKKFFVRFGQEQGYKQSNEVRALKKLRREISAKLPVDPLEKLNSDLQKAIKHERYEDAARIRDEIAKLTATSEQ